jgi:hypothetical protein
MAEISPGKIVEDWGGFEKLVAKLHETGTVTVEHNVTLTGQSGAPRQIDVLVRHSEGLYEHLILVECKHWKSNVKRIQIDSMATAVRDLKASKGVIFTTKDFQSGVVTMAEAVGVELVKVREFSDAEWGQPGRHVDFYIQYFQRSIGNPNITAAVQTIPGVEPSAPRLNLQIGGEEGEVDTTFTATFKTDGMEGDSLEKLLINKSAEALAQVIQGHHFDLGTEEDDISAYVTVPVNLELPNQLVAKVDGTYILISKIAFDLGVKILQTRFKLDRQAQYQFALAVENKVSGKITTATRKRDTETTNLSAFARKEVPAGEQPVESGSILKFALKAFFPFAEVFAGQKPQRIYAASQPGKSSP